MDKVFITYLGHSAFCINGNKTVVIDPFNNIGFDMQSVQADFCLCSHGHFDHNASHLVSGATVVNGESDKNLATDISLNAVKSFHDDCGGAKRGLNNIYTFIISGIKFCHLGDLGIELTTAQLSALGEVDVLFCPIGGTYTIDASLAHKVIKSINAKLVVPMHYKTAKSTIDVATIESFLQTTTLQVTFVNNTFEISKQDLSKNLGVFVPSSSNL